VSSSGREHYREYTPDAVLLLEIITSAQNAGFSLQEIRRLMPPRSDASLDSWHHDELVGALKRRLPKSRRCASGWPRALERLHGIIDTIENRPEG